MACALDPNVLEALSALGRHCIEELTDYLTDTFLREDLKTLITENGAWEAFVETAKLSSQEQAALYDALKKRLKQKPTEENKRLERGLQEKRFLKEFPELKRKLEEHIRKLRDLADHLDQVHKACTISNVVSGSVSLASGACGLAMAPVTGGASLALGGLGAAAGVTAISTTAVEEANRITDEAEARRLIGAGQNIVKEILKIIPKFTVKLINTGVDLVSAWKTIGQEIHAIRMARASSRSRTQARSLRNFARRFAQGSEEVGNDLPDSTLPMTPGARRLTVGISITLLAFVVYHLVTDSMDLYNGATTESGRALRDLALKLEEKLKEFEQIQKDL